MLVEFSRNEDHHRGCCAGFPLEASEKNFEWFSSMFANFIDFSNIKFKRQRGHPKSILKWQGLFSSQDFQAGVFSEVVWSMCHTNRAEVPRHSHSPPFTPVLPLFAPSFNCPWMNPWAKAASHTLAIKLYTSNSCNLLNTWSMSGAFCVLFLLVLVTPQSSYYPA